ncbi:hypothetical protein [Bradyrhizobium sp. CCGUVB23]|uniref:hypothetical protein n=1 Tax=Bradyrhizobium sp. CCGUVB23 TaxID=2949630 RepID=UPI0020B3AFD8|nr:hypothetical protein [Bradyrhizobium sp. CCGUVB23]MCP3464430.1 hypothetical protein [Bradyrhizobium sp. CCGUVB23]
MQFFLYEIVARIVAIYLCVDCFRKVRSGLVERKITACPHSTGILDIIVDSLAGLSKRVVHRDTAPVQYWLEMGLQTFGLLGCAGVAMFGWFHPNT